MKLRTLSLPLSLTLGLAASAFAADQPGVLPPAAAQAVQTQTSVAPATKTKGMRIARKHGKGKHLARTSPQQVTK